MLQTAVQHSIAVFGYTACTTPALILMLLLLLLQVDCGADEVVVKGYFRQLLAGCRHCHSQGVCHRDLKPENLLLADHGEHPILKIADFGFSTLLQEMVSSITLFTLYCSVHRFQYCVRQSQASPSHY
jgi:serine/threonine protein kinase